MRLRALRGATEAAKLITSLRLPDYYFFTVPLDPLLDN